MNQFKKYNSKLKKISKAYTMAQKFDRILNDAWCRHSIEKAIKSFGEISSEIENPYCSRIHTELQHVYLGHGIHQSRLALKCEVEKYIEYLINEFR